MRSDEIRDAGHVLGDALEVTTRSVAEVHDAVSARIFGMLGRPARPVQLMHDGLARSVYGIVRQSTRIVPRVGGAVAARYRRPDAPSVADTRAGTQVLGAINGAWGDQIAQHYRGLEYTMGIRRTGRTIQVARADLTHAYPDANGRLVVFLHGLCESDESWTLASLRHYGDETTSFGSRLQEDLGLTPVWLRYNTGLHVSENGRRFAVLMQALVDEWPVPVEEIVLVGHSMGGLVMRSACWYAENPPGGRQPMPWTEQLRHAFYLGTPHLGAPLEQRTARVSRSLARRPETAPVARLLNSRSVGVKDLRHGSLRDDDWAEVDLDSFLDDRCTEVPVLPTAHYYYIGATLNRSADHPVSRLLGDMLVLLPSASAQGPTRSIPFEVERGRHLGGLNHFALLNHPSVYDQIRTWLTPRLGSDAVEPGSAATDAQK